MQAVITKRLRGLLNIRYLDVALLYAYFLLAIRLDNAKAVIVFSAWLFVINAFTLIASLGLNTVDAKLANIPIKTLRRYIWFFSILLLVISLLIAIALASIKQNYIPRIYLLSLSVFVLHNFFISKLKSLYKNLSIRCLYKIVPLVLAIVLLLVLSNLDRYEMMDTDVIKYFIIGFSLTLGIELLLLIYSLYYRVDDHPGNTLLEPLKTILPSLAKLVMSFVQYFRLRFMVLLLFLLVNAKLAALVYSIFIIINSLLMLHPEKIALFYKKTLNQLKQKPQIAASIKKIKTTSFTYNLPVCVITILVALFLLNKFDYHYSGLELFVFLMFVSIFLKSIFFIDKTIIFSYFSYKNQLTFKLFDLLQAILFGYVGLVLFGIVGLGIALIVSELLTIFFAKTFTKLLRVVT